MRVDLSEPECINCYHSRPSGVFPTQASELSNVIGSSPVSSGTVQALGDDSAAVGSTSTSSPLQALGDDSAAAGSTSTLSPLQTLRDDSAAGGSTSTSSPLQALRDDSAAGGSTSTLSPLQALGDDSAAAGSTPTSSQALRDDSAAVGSTSTSSPLPALGDDSAAAGSTSTSSPVHTSSPPLFGSPLPSITSISSGLAQSPACNLFENCAFESLSHRPDFQSPVKDTSACCASATSRSPLQSSSPFGLAPAVTSVSSAPTQAFGPTASGFGTFAGAPTPSLLFGKGVAFARPDIGLSPASSSSTTTVVFGTTPASVSSPFGPIQASTSTFLPFGSVPASSLCNSVFGCPPASSSSNLFRPNPSTNASVSSPFGFSPSVTSVSSAPTQTFGPKAVFSPSTASPSIFASPSVPDHSQKTNFATTQGNFSGPGFGCGFSPAAVSGATTFPSGGFSQPNAPSASHDWSRRTEQGSRCPGYAPTPDEETRKGDIYISISASKPYLYKSHEELRWEDYKQGCCAPIPGPAFGFPSAAFSFSQPNALFTGGGTHFPSSLFSSSTTFPGVSSSVQRPHEAAAVSSPPFGFPPSVASASSAPTQNFGPKAVFSLSTASPSIFASPSVPDHSQKTNFAATQGNFSGPSFGCGFYPAPVSGTTTFPSGGFGQPNAPSAFSFSQPNAPFTGGGTHFPSSFSSSSTSFPGVSSSVQRPHEAAAVSSPPFRCTACGATSSSSASPNFTFNGATAPPSAAISLPWLFYPTSGFGTSSAAQVTSPAPVQGYILLPFAAMSLQ